MLQSKAGIEHAELLLKERMPAAAGHNDPAQSALLTSAQLTTFHQAVM